MTTGEPKTSGSARIYTGETPAALFPGEREERAAGGAMPWSDGAVKVTTAGGGDDLGSAQGAGGRGAELEGAGRVNV